MKAYKNDPAFRDAFIAEMQWHKEQDKFKHGSYGEGSNGDFRGCAVGCGIHSLARLQKRKLNTADHSILAKELDVPVELFHLQDGLFEALPLDRAATWPLEFSEAIACGADLSMVHIHFMYWLLVDEQDGVIRFAGEFQAVKDSILQVAALLARHLSGLPVTRGQWSAAEAAAWSAAEVAAWSAAEAAEAAARSAARSAAEVAAEAAAWSAAEAAAWSAAEAAAWSAAWSAAEAAAWSAAWSAVWSAARIKQADKLLQLIKEAPVSELETA